MGGSKRADTHQATNLLDVCGQGNASGCHGEIEKRGNAYDEGWLVRQGQDPAAIPVRLWHGRKALLTIDGEYADAPTLSPCTLTGVGTATRRAHQEDSTA